MKIFYLFFFIVLLSCNNIKKNYVCGDRPCLDKKEFNEYFAANLSIEIKTKENKKDKNFDLIKLNTGSLNSNKDDNKLSKKDQKLKKKAEKEKLKAEKYQLIEERKIKKAEKKIIEKENKQLAKASKSKKKKKTIIKNEINDTVKQVKNVIDESITDKSNTNQILSTEVKVDTAKSQKIKSVCDEINDCDIDKIAERLIKKGKNKPFPNITSN